MEPSSWILLGLTAVTLGLMLWRGRWPERIAAAAFLAVIVVSTFLDRVVYGGVRWWVALASLGLFLTLVSLSLTARRWWLLGAAGLQLVALATHGASMLDADLNVWASVSVRYLVWLELMLLGLFGVWEARRAPYARPNDI